MARLEVNNEVDGNLLDTSEGHLVDNERETTLAPIQLREPKSTQESGNKILIWNFLIVIKFGYIKTEKVLHLLAFCPRSLG